MEKVRRKAGPCLRKTEHCFLNVFLIFRGKNILIKYLAIIQSLGLALEHTLCGVGTEAFNYSKLLSLSPEMHQK